MKILIEVEVDQTFTAGEAFEVEKGEKIYVVGGKAYSIGHMKGVIEQSGWVEISPGVRERNLKQEVEKSNKRKEEKVKRKRNRVKPHRVKTTVEELANGFAQHGPCTLENLQKLLGKYFEPCSNLVRLAILRGWLENITLDKRFGTYQATNKWKGLINGTGANIANTASQGPAG